MNLAVLLSRAARAHPDKPALVQGDRILDYREFNRRTGRLAGALRDLGVGEGDRVAILQHNAPPFLETLFALFRLGAVAVPLNVRLHPREVRYILEHSLATAVIHGDFFKPRIPQARRGTSVRHWISTGSPASADSLGYESLLAQAPVLLADADLEEDALAWLFYTSGTTGKPKGAMLSHRNLLAMTMSFFADHYVPDETDVALHAAPLSHGSGLYALPLVARAVTNILHDSVGFIPARVFEEITRWKVTLIPFLAPTQIKRLAEEPIGPGHDLSSLRAIAWGGAPMYVEDARRAAARFGPILTELYGLGESPMTITALSRRAMAAELEKAPALLTAGLPRTDVEIRIVNEAGQPLPAGSAGEVLVRGGVVMKGYWNNPQATAESLRQGWLHTGDLGYLDERGFLYLVDRKNDMILSGGYNIYPREVEEALMEHPQVAEVAVFGVPDPEWGESVKAAVRPRDPQAPPSVRELIAFCRERIASFKKPRSVVFVEEIPKNAYGKTLRRELRERFGSPA